MKKSLSLLLAVLMVVSCLTIGVFAAYETGNYRVSASIGVNLRAGAGTSYSKLDAIPYNTVLSISEISGNWGKTTYCGQTGWVCLDYATYIKTSSAGDGEYAIFPADILSVTQGAYGEYNSFSHNGQTGFYQMAFDFSSDSSDYYAPFSGTIVDIKESYNAVCLQSDGKVHWANGEYDYMSVVFVHDNDISDLWVGKHINQGEVFYQPGVKGYADGSHVHLCVNKGLTTSGINYFSGDIRPNEAFFVPSTTEIRKTGNYTWVNLPNISKDTTGTTVTMSYSPSESYKSGKYYDALCNVQITGNQAVDLINVALSQVGYHEGNNTSQLDGTNTSGTGDYTEAGYWFGINVKNLTYGWYSEWCAMFVSWCARQAGISTDVISNAANAKASDSIYCFKNLTYTDRSSASPKIGDLIFFDYASSAEPWDHVGIVYKVDSSYVYTVEGNSGKAVQKNIYSLNTSSIKGYGRPNYATSNTVATCSVKYDANGGGYAPQAQTKTVGETLKISVDIPTRDGYQFVGWSLEKDSKQIDYLPGDDFTKNESVTLYAIWNDAEDWTEWSDWSEIKVEPSINRVVEAKTVYRYYHYILMYSDGNCGAYPIDEATFNTYLPSYPVTRKDYHDDIYSDTPLTRVEKLTYDQEYDCYENIHCPADYNYDNGENASYVYYLRTETWYRYRDAMEEDCSSVDDFKYSVDSTTNEVTITGYTGSNQYITIPSKIEGNPVTKIGDSAFYGKTSLISIELPESVAYIGKASFRECSNLIEIIIPDSVVSIGEYAFYSCSNLSNIDLPSNITRINNYTFNYCKSIAEIEIPNDVTSIGQYAFCGCESLTNIIIPDCVKTIERSAFDTCKNLTGVSIGKGLITIETYAFYCCYALADITIPGNVTTIGQYAFKSCHGLSTVTLEKGVKTINQEAFVGCTGLTSINIPNSVIQLGDAAFSGCTGLQSITIPASVVSFGSSAFLGCTGLSSVTLEDGLKNIGEYAFSGCTGLTTIEIPGSISTLGNGSFYECKNLKSVVIKDGVKTIGADSFRYCSALSSISIPQSVITINGYAFGYCTALEEITLPSKITYLNSGLFSGCTSLMSITIPSSVTQIYNNAFYDCGKLSSVVLSENLTAIRYNAFSYCTALTNIVFNEKLTTIESAVFYKSGLTEITLPKSVTTISSNSFEACNSLTTVKFMGSTLTGIEAFKSSYCPNLKTVYVYTNSTADKYFDSENYTKIYLDEPIAVENVTLNKTSATLTEGDTLTLTATVAPTNATNKNMTWKSSDTTVATVSNGVVTAKKAGTATITVTTADGSKTATCTVTVKAAFDPNALTFTVESAKAIAGKTVTVGIVISNNPGIAGFSFKVGYDSSVMTLIGYDCPGWVANSSGFDEDPTNNPVGFSWSRTTNYTSNKTILTLTFEIKADAPAGEYDISLTTTDIVTNQDKEKLNFNLVGGKITVVESEPGDLSGDGEINSIDAVLLAQYIAGWDVELDGMAADCNGDGDINSIDAVLLAQFIAGWDVTLG